MQTAARCSRQTLFGLQLCAVVFLAAPLLASCRGVLPGWAGRSSSSAQNPVAPPPAPEPPLALIPFPQELVRHEGHFTVAAGTQLVCPEGDKGCAWLAGYLSDLARRTRGIELVPASGDVSGAPSGTVVFRRLAYPLSANPEAYRLEVGPGGVVISAGTDAGLFYGAVTFWQLLSQDSGPARAIAVPALQIVDAPRFGWRGMLLDSARHFQSLGFVKSFIDAMALHKLNVLHWHLTDDQGWRLQIKRYPKLTAAGAWRRIPGQSGLYGGYYSQKEVRGVVAYARQRNVTIVPEIEMPGHSLAAIAAYPRLASVRRPPRSVSSDWGIFPYLYNTDDASFSFLENVLTEVMALFPSRYIHIGGDEAVKDEWNSSPRTRRLMRARHIKDEDALQSYFVDRIGKFLNAHGRRLIGWDEILNNGLTQNAAITSWHGIGGAITAARLGHDAVLSPSNKLYFSNCQVETAGEPPCRADFISLKDVYDFDPATPQLNAEQQAHIIGLEACIWTEYIADGSLVDYAAFPRAAALAELAWSPAAKHDWRDFLQRLPAQIDRYRALGIPHSESALTVRIDARADGAGGRVSLANQVGFGEIHYTRDGSVPTATSPLYTVPFATALPATIAAAAFWHERPLTAPLQKNLDVLSVLRRSSYAMKQCTSGLPLSLAGGVKTDGKPAMFLVNVMDPCWIYEQADLSRIGGVEVTVGRLPFNFQIGKDIRKIPLYPPQTPAGELEIRLDTCQGKRIAVLPLAPAATGNAITTLRARFEPQQSIHDVCFTFTRRSVDPVWAIDEAQLIPEATPHKE
ncbi:MAG: family 20 glycosylhydrolase [Alphaproteobacteria bacterium]|nr:family 20 glycosylhydrolase [Alphaproteobacteria bacterium]